MSSAQSESDDGGHQRSISSRSGMGGGGSFPQPSQMQASHSVASQLPNATNIDHSSSHLINSPMTIGGDGDKSMGLNTKLPMAKGPLSNCIQDDIGDLVSGFSGLKGAIQGGFNIQHGDTLPTTPNISHLQGGSVHHIFGKGNEQSAG